MASPSDYRESGSGGGSGGGGGHPNRKVPHSLATGFFSKSARKVSDGRSPIHSPTLNIRGPPPGRTAMDSPVYGPSTDRDRYDTSTTPIAIPQSPSSVSRLGGQKQKKLAAPTSLNSHYRSISRSMNDLGSMFSRGRSPPNRGTSPKRGGVVVTYDRGRTKTPASPHSRHFEVPSISIEHHGEQSRRQRVVREGWLNHADLATVKKTAIRDAWKLQQAIIRDHFLLLFKPPSGCQIRSFELVTTPVTTPRPQSAPAVSTPSFNVSTLRHRSTTRHPELVLRDDGQVQAGTVEALCHELMFTEDLAFVNSAVPLLSSWTGPETALSVLIELSGLKDLSARNAEIIQKLADMTPGLLLEPGFFNCARLLVEKGITPHNAELAKSCRNTLEARKRRLGLELRLSAINEGRARDLNRVDIPKLAAETSRSATDNPPTLTADDFLRWKPEAFAAQIYLFHLKYFRAWSPTMDISLLLVSPHLPPPSHRNPLVFSTNSLHFLGERVLSHILTGDSIQSMTRRSVLISQWGKVSQILRRMGDMVGYTAILMAILSPPILRLRETWGLVDADLLTELNDLGVSTMRIIERRKLGDEGSDYGQVLLPSGMDVKDAHHEHAVPYFGDLLHCMDEAYASRGRNINFQKMLTGMAAISSSLDAFKLVWDKTCHIPGDTSGRQLEDERLQRCLEFLNANNQNPPTSGSAPLFDLSLTCEPSSSGMYLSSHYHQRLPLSTGANVPLLFTELRTSFSLFDRYDTLAISGNLHKKTPSSGLSSPGLSSSHLPPGPQANQSLRPPTSHGTQQIRRTRSFPPPSSSAQTTGFDELDYTTRERTAVLHGGDGGMLKAIRDVAGVDQQLFNSKDGELVLKSIIDEAQSRPVSVILETTSKRYSTSSRRHSQIVSASVSPRASVHYDSSFPSASNREPAETPSLLVVPKGGTLERLVDILVLGVEDFSRRMNRGDNSRPSDGHPPLKMDMDVFTITFFATFRSYCSPVVLLDYLKKRLLGSKSAATFARDEGDDVVFPDWTGVDHIKEDAIDWNLVAKIHVGILEAVKVWVTEFYMDFHCDQYLRESFTAFIGIAATEISVWKDVVQKRQYLRSEADHIDEVWHEIRETYAMMSFTPCLYASPLPSTANLRLAVPSPTNVASIGEFLDIMDRRVSQLFETIKLVDWMFAFEMLETQSADSLGYFMPKISLLANAEEEPIQNIFTLLQNLRWRETTSTVLEVLPKSVRDLCSLHLELSAWVLNQVVDPRISVEQRADRIVALLKALTIARKRMSGMDLYETSDSKIRRQVPSFVGNVIATALVRPESRMYSFAWQLAVRNLSGTISQIDTLEQVIPQSVDGIIPLRPLTPCIGWMMERLLEIICYVPNMVVENNRLINFDKRRYVYNFINNFTNNPEQLQNSDEPGLSPISLDTFDIRALREAANRENQNSRHGKIKVFWKLVNQEHDKLRRDGKQRDILERQQRNQLRAENRRQPPAIQTNPAEKKSGKRLGVNSIFKAVRPISMALTGQWPPPQNSPRIVPAGDLPSIRPLEHGKKASLSIDLQSVLAVQCSQGLRNKCTFRIIVEDKGTFYFQATSEKDLDDWLKTIASIRGTNTSDGGESIDLLAEMSSNRAVIPQPVFGVSLEELSKRENSKIPRVVEMLLSEIESRGLGEVGIYRVPGSLASINALKAALDSGEDVSMDDDRWYDINVAAGTFKLFMRDLPDRAIPDDVLEQLKNLTNAEADEECRVQGYKEIVSRLPPHNYHFLRRVYRHFSLVSSNASVNKMSAVNLAIVFGMGLSPGTSSFGISPDLGAYQTMVRAWINNADEIFPEREESAHRAESMAFTESGDTQNSEPLSPMLVTDDHSMIRRSLEEFRSVVEGGSTIG